MKLFFLFFLFNYHLYGAWQTLNRNSTIQMTGSSAKINLSKNLTIPSGIISLSSTTNPVFATTSTSKSVILNDVTLRKNEINQQNVNVFLGGDNLDTMFLNGDAALRSSCSVNYFVNVSGKNNSIAQNPQFTEKITLADQDTELTIAINNKLTKSIVLNNGTIILSQDLHLKENVFFEGNGTLNLAGFGLHTSVQEETTIFAGNLKFINAKDLNVRYKTNLTGTWLFEGDSKTSNMIGYNNIIDLTGGGKIKVGPNHKLIMQSVILKGLGNLNGSLDIHPTSTISFKYCNIGLSDTLNFSSGTILCDADSNTVKSSQASKLLIDGSNAFLNVNKTFLYLELADGLGTPSVEAVNDGKISKTNGGDIITSSNNIFAQKIIKSLTDSEGENFIKFNLELDYSRILFFKNPTPGIAVNMTFNGNGNKLTFNANSNEESIIVDEGVTLKMKNINLNGFDPSKITFLGSGANTGKIIYSDNTVFSLRKDIELTNQMTVSGSNIVLFGANNFFTINSNIKITENSSFTFSCVNLELLSEQAILGLGETSNVCFQCANIKIGVPLFMFDKGSIDFYGENYISSFSNSSGTKTTFNFCTNQSCTIRSKSSLVLDDQTRFFYNPNTSADTTLTQKRGHLIFEDDSANLTCNGTLFEVAQDGIMFNAGNILSMGTCTFKTNQAFANSRIKIVDPCQFNISNETIFDGVVEI